jgi:peptidoglycan/xylan/chitin deacetylase (PgdA/CDA1 family)
MPTQICITIDVEFSIGGAFAAPDRDAPIGAPAVLCSAGGREHGLGFILETLQRFGLPATFFVEALNPCYFGDEPMGRIAQRIVAEGHEVQLHLHPNWLYFRHPDWRRRLSVEPHNDSCSGRRDGELDEMISLGIDAFRRWGVPRPVALRTGNLKADRAVYRAMARHGLPLASNVACAIWRPDDPDLRFLGGRHRVEGIVELPVLTYTDFAIGRWRHRHNLTITGSSSREIATLLDDAKAQNLSPVVLLTHPFEFVNRRNKRYTKVRPHRTNRARFRELCRRVADDPGEIRAVTFAGGMTGWAAAGESDDAELRVPGRVAAGRLLTGRIDDWLRIR